MKLRNTIEYTCQKPLDKRKNIKIYSNQWGTFCCYRFIYLYINKLEIIVHKKIIYYKRIPYFILLKISAYDRKFKLKIFSYTYLQS